MPDEPAKLPRRVARVTHALMEAWTQHGGGVPVTTAEVCVYDGTALSASGTHAALRRAVARGLASGAGRGLWVATNRAWEMRRRLEELVIGWEDDDA